MASGAMTITKRQSGETPASDTEPWRRKCGCIRTSDKLRMILNSFPSPPPPTPIPNNALYDDESTRQMVDAKCTDSYGMGYCYFPTTKKTLSFQGENKKSNNQSWVVVSDVVHLVQLSVTAAALAIYYIIYCYMQLVYYTLRSAIYFHNADGPMKITIGVVTLTSIVVGFNVLVRMERVLGALY